MASVVASRARRSSSVERIEPDLTALWRDVAHDEPVSRAVMSNLVVFCRCPVDTGEDVELPHADLGVDEVVQRHPARVIVLGHDPSTGARRDRSSPVISASVEVLTFGTSGARYGVEQIVIRSACGDAAIRSIVRQLTLGDIPTTVWWTEDLSTTEPLTPLVKMGRQFLYDSRCWADVRAATLALAPLLTDPFRPDLADRNWRRLAPVRRALHFALESRDAAHHGATTPLRVRHRHGETALAWLMAGWAHVAEHVRHVTDRPIADVRLEPPTEDTRMDGDVLTASLDDGFRLRVTDDRVIVEDPVGLPPFAVALSREPEADAIAGELGVLAEDATFHQVLAALVGHFQRG
ncbi:MAG TPA: glucose-6-phosphate dehydrogenase assembly protein OpcA [Vicinamibacterales bacterium]|nr:glucose-6-phosphate dehydrogenase assembly protein OpcA [Vicinamibacterales bacterium]